MYCPLLRIQPGQKGECLEHRCAWWISNENSSCAIVWIAEWLRRLSMNELHS